MDSMGMGRWQSSIDTGGAGDGGRGGQGGRPQGEPTAFYKPRGGTHADTEGGSHEVSRTTQSAFFLPCDH